MQNEERFKSIECNIKDLTDQLTSLDKLVTKVVVSLESHVRTERETEDTIKNIDRNLTDLMIKIAEGPGERHREIQGIVSPIWDSIRKSNKKIKECEEHVHDKLDDYNEKVKKEIYNTARTHVVVIWMAIVTVASLASYIYVNDIRRVEKDIESLTNRIYTVEKVEFTEHGKLK